MDKHAGNLIGPLLVTMLWYYLLLILQLGTKYRLKTVYEKSSKEFDCCFGNDEEMLAADRVIINTEEQMGPFLVSLWLHTVFVLVFWITLSAVTRTSIV